MDYNSVKTISFDVESGLIHFNQIQIDKWVEVKENEYIPEISTAGVVGMIHQLIHQSKYGKAISEYYIDVDIVNSDSVKIWIIIRKLHQQLEWGEKHSVDVLNEYAKSIANFVTRIITPKLLNTIYTTSGRKILITPNNTLIFCVHALTY
jgi:hypothetical protein